MFKVGDYSVLTHMMQLEVEQHLPREWKATIYREFDMLMMEHLMTLRIKDHNGNAHANTFVVSGDADEESVTIILLEKVKESIQWLMQLGL